MSKTLSPDTRVVMALARESARMREAAERVDLVVQAMALRRGIKFEPYYGPDETESAIVK